MRSYSALGLATYRVNECSNEAMGATFDPLRSGHPMDTMVEFENGLVT